MGSPIVPLPEELVSIAKQTARAMTCRGLSQSDVEDMEQVVSLRAWLSLRYYSPDRGPLSAYLQTVISRAALNFMRDQRASRRAPIRMTSLQREAFRDSESTDFSQLISRAELDARTGGTGEDEFTVADRLMDVNEFINQLSPDDRKLVQLLKWQLVSQIAVALNVPRTTVSDRVRRLRKRFEVAGLHEYLQKRSSKCGRIV